MAREWTPLVAVRLPGELLTAIDQLVLRGRYLSRSDAVRSMARAQLMLEREHSQEAGEEAA
jgi:Arc/MetJ-type ribon-helix-helix transcriptional regulator